MPHGPRSRVFSVETFRANRRLQFAAGSSFKQRQEPKYHLRSAAVNNPRNKDPSRPRKRLTEREVGALHEALLHAVSHRHPCRAVQRKHLPLLPRDVAVDEEMTVAELARRMGIDVRRLSEHLLSMGEELGPEDEISPDTAEVVVIDFGQTCSRIDQKYPCVGAATSATCLAGCGSCPRGAASGSLHGVVQASLPHRVARRRG